MQAILTVQTKDPEGKLRDKRLFFDTDRSKEVCDVVNEFGYKVQTIFLSPGGWLFLRDNNRGTLKVGDQKSIKDYIGEHYPEKYEKVFGKVEEA